MLANAQRSPGFSPRKSAGEVRGAGVAEGRSTKSGVLTPEIPSRSPAGRRRTGPLNEVREFSPRKSPGWRAPRRASGRPLNEVRGSHPGDPPRQEGRPWGRLARRSTKSGVLTPEIPVAHTSDTDSM